MTTIASAMTGRNELPLAPARTARRRKPQRPAATVPTLARHEETAQAARRLAYCEWLSAKLTA